MYMTYVEQTNAEDLRSSAIVLHYAATLFLNAAHTAGDDSAVTAGQSIIDLLRRVMPEASQLPS